MTDVTSSVVRVGNPADDYSTTNSRGWTYAKNPWDMQVYGGKLYIGSGNSSNFAPDSNAGPAPVLAYDPVAGTFANEYTTDSEQVDKFRVLDFGGSQGTQLVIPSHDPRSDNNLAWFGLRAGTWRKHQGVAAGTPTHTYDMVVVGSHILPGTGIITYVGNTADVNDSGGETWTFMSSPSGQAQRGYATFVLGGVGYVAGHFLVDDSASWLYAYSGSAAVFTRATDKFSSLFPGTLTSEVTSDVTPIKAAKIQRPTNFESSLVYVGSGEIDDHQSQPFGLYQMSAVGSSSRVSLPNSVIPWDLLVSGGTLYVLGAYTSGSDTVVSVVSTTDLSTWTEQFSFIPNNVGAGSQGQTFARSFEQIGSTWYFGLGSPTSPIPTNTGDILAYTPSAGGTDVAAPSMTLNTAGNALASGSVAASATTSFEIDASTKFEAQVVVKVTEGASVAATAGVRVDVFARYGSSPTNTATNPNYSLVIPAGAGNAVVHSPRIHLPTGKWHVVLTNLDASNAVTVEATSDTIDSI